MKILVIDNYDSFTYNLVQLVGRFTPDVVVRRNDRVTIPEIIDLVPDKIIISPGPGRPEESNISLAVITELGKDIPVLGVCLGHQSIGISFGAKVVRAPYLMHGKISRIHHDNKISQTKIWTISVYRDGSVHIGGISLDDQLHR